MLPRNLDSADNTGIDTGLPHPSKGARWRWARRRAMVGGGVLAAALGVGTAAAGASTEGNAPASSPGHQGRPPSGIFQPTTGGKVTAVTGDSITIENRNQTSQTVTYSATTTFRTLAGTSSSTALKNGDFIAVRGTKNSDGSVTATNIMISTSPPGAMGKGGGGGPGGGPPHPKGAPAG